MYAWNKRRTGKEHTICENCGGIIYWMNHIGTCTGACSNTRSAKAICGEMTSIICKIADIDSKLKGHDEQYNRVKRFESGTMHHREHFSSLFLDKELRAVVINTVKNYITNKSAKLEVDRKKLVDQHTELSNMKWKRNA